MNRLLLALLLLSPSIHAASPRVNAVKCEWCVFQADTSQGGKLVLLQKDTVEFVQGLRTSGFAVAFSMEIEFARIDTGSVQYSLHVVTPGPSPSNYSREYTSQYGLPARLEPIIGKNGASYVLTLKPFQRIKVDTVGSGQVHYRKEDFKFDPSAHADIYFAAKTHGDYYWNNIKYLLEDNYDAFAALANFNIPGKFQVYLCPYLIRSVIWDKRFNVMVDPTRNNVFAVYTTTHNTADPVVLLQAAIYKNYGYAPALLTEGMAGYLSFTTFDTKELVRQKKNLPLDSLFGTYYYLKADPRVVDLMSTSFAKYLIDQYKIDRFMTMYRRADDVNLRAVAAEVYGKSVTELEKDWLHYVDTVGFTKRQYVTAAQQSETMFNYPGMLKYRLAELGVLTSAAETAQVATEIARSYFFKGDYEDAATWQQKSIALDTPRGMSVLTMATYRMMAGQYDSALAELQRAQQLDTGNSVIKFNIGYYHLIRGAQDQARDIFSEVVLKAPGAEASAECRILLANLSRESKSTAEQFKARDYYAEAIRMLTPTMSGTFVSSTSFMWAGIAYLGQGDTESAQSHLDMALFLETRPFYQAMDYLWLGKVSDVRGERDVAKEYYRKVLNMPAAAYHITEAQALLEHPYK